MTGTDTQNVFIGKCFKHVQILGNISGIDIETQINEEFSKDGKDSNCSEMLDLVLGT